MPSFLYRVSFALSSTHRPSSLALPHRFARQMTTRTSGALAATRTRTRGSGATATIRMRTI
jgi:hypothetical protein